MSIPGQQWFHDTVSALAYSLAQPHECPPALAPPHNDLTQFILRQHAQMPDYLRTPMQLATLGSDVSGLAHGGKPCHQQSAEKRTRQIAAWKNSSIGIPRDLIRYFESLATLALYSRETERRPPTRLDGVWDSQRAGSEIGAPIRRLANFWLGLILIQVALGAWTIWSNKAADVATAHVVVGSLSLVTGALGCLICVPRIARVIEAQGAPLSEDPCTHHPSMAINP